MKRLEQEIVTDRPWKGPDAITGLTMDDFAERLETITLPDSGSGTED